LNPAVFWTEPESETALDNESQKGRNSSFRRRKNPPLAACTGFDIDLRREYPSQRTVNQFRDQEDLSWHCAKPSGGGRSVFHLPSIERPLQLPEGGLLPTGDR
jgi:hypothetical protein